MWRALLWTGALGLIVAVLFGLRFGSRTVELSSVAALDVPRRARLDKPGNANEHPEWVGFRLDRYHTWAMGSSTPYRASLFVNLHAKGASSGSYDEALRDNELDLNGGADDWKPVLRDEQWDIGQGRYTINMLNEPTWRIKYRDPSRQVSILWQVHQKDWKLDAAKAALQRMAASIVRKQEPDFAEIADRPRRAALENERKANAAFAWLAERGYGTLEPEIPVTRNGITVEFRSNPERRLMLLRLIDGKPLTPLPEYVAHGWRTWTDSAGWEDTMPDGDYYPSPGTRALMDRTLTKPGPHYFLIRTLRLDEMDETAFHIADFFEFATNFR